MRRVLIGLGVVVVAIGGVGLLAWGPAASHAEAATAVVEDAAFEWRYAYAGGAAQRAELRAAIEGLADEMNPLIASMAKKRLTAANPVLETLGFSLSGDPLRASYIEGRLVESPASGAEVGWTDHDGDPVRVRQRWNGRTLDQHMSDGRGWRRNTYRFSADGARMTMRVHIESSMLPRPLEYRLDYRRVEPK